MNGLPGGELTKLDGLACPLDRLLDLHRSPTLAARTRILLHMNDDSGGCSHLLLRMGSKVSEFLPHRRKSRESVGFFFPNP
jgi:hypothetical protein